MGGAASQAAEDSVVLNGRHHPGPYKNHKWHCCNQAHPKAEPCHSGQVRHHTGAFRDTPWRLASGCADWSCCGSPDRNCQGCKAGPNPNAYQGGVSHNVEGKIVAAALVSTVATPLVVGAASTAAASVGFSSATNAIAGNGLVQTAMKLHEVKEQVNEVKDIYDYGKQRSDDRKTANSNRTQ